MKFFIKIMIILVLSGIIFQFFLWYFNVFSLYNSIGITSGFIAAFLFVSSGFLSFYIALRKKNKIFLRTVIVSILSRLLFIIIVILFIIQYLNLDLKMFFVSLFIWYFIFQILEITSFNRLEVKESS